MLDILWRMIKWPWKYKMWRLDTAYPTGWKYAIGHPIIFIKDIYKYIKWCQMMDKLEK